MVPFGPCPTVPAGHGIPGAWLTDGSELDPRPFARASRLTAVSMDMTGGYAKSVREHAPQATIVIDNYHVVQLATKALDEVRREHWNELRHAGETDAAKQFKHDRWALLKNPDDLSDQQATTLAAIQAGGGKVARAWAMKEMVRAIFAPGLTVNAVSELLDRLLARLSRCRLKPFIRLGRTIRKHREGILAARRLKLSNARAEALNNKRETDRPPRVRVPLRPEPRSRSFTSPADRSHSPSHTNGRSCDLTYDHARVGLLIALDDRRSWGPPISPRTTASLLTTFRGASPGHRPLTTAVQKSISLDIHKYANQSDLENAANEAKIYGGFVSQSNTLILSVAASLRAPAVMPVGVREGRQAGGSEAAGEGDQHAPLARPRGGRSRHHPVRNAVGRLPRLDVRDAAHQDGGNPPPSPGAARPRGTCRSGDRSARRPDPRRLPKCREQLLETVARVRIASASPWRCSPPPCRA